MNAYLSDDMEKFLKTLESHGGKARSQALGCAFNNVDKARQACRKKRYATFNEGHWLLTDLGRSVLRGDDNPPPSTETLLKAIKEAKGLFEQICDLAKIGEPDSRATALSLIESAASDAVNRLNVLLPENTGIHQ